MFVKMKTMADKYPQNVSNNSTLECPEQFWDILCLSLNKYPHLGNSGGKDR